MHEEANLERPRHDFSRINGRISDLLTIVARCPRSHTIARDQATKGKRLDRVVLHTADVEAISCSCHVFSLLLLKLERQSLLVEIFRVDLVE